MSLLSLREYTDVETVRDVLESNPQAAQEKDDDGKFPLHRALYNECSSEVVKMVY